MDINAMFLQLVKEAGVTSGLLDDTYDWGYDYDTEFSFSEGQDLLVVYLLDENGNVLDSLGGVDVDFQISDHGNVNVSPEGEIYLKQLAQGMAEEHHTASLVKRAERYQGLDDPEDRYKEYDWPFVDSLLIEDMEPFGVAPGFEDGWYTPYKYLEPDGRIGWEILAGDPNDLNTVTGGLTMRDAYQSANTWNRKPFLAPDHSQFHDPSMFGLISRKRAISDGGRVEYEIDKSSWGPGIGYTIADIVIKDLVAMTGSMKLTFAVNGVEFLVYYDEEQAYGDLGGPVQGDVTGEYEVVMDNRVVFRQHVSPHGTSPYGNPLAKSFSAKKVAEFIGLQTERKAKTSRRKTAAERPEPWPETACGEQDDDTFCIRDAGHEGDHQFRSRQWIEQKMDESGANSIEEEVPQEGEEGEEQVLPEENGGEEQEKGEIPEQFKKGNLYEGYPGWEVIPHTEIHVGDIIANSSYQGQEPTHQAEVLRPVEESVEGSHSPLAGRPVWMYWARSLEDGREGYLFYGSGGVALRKLLKTAMRKGAPFADYKNFADCTSKNSDKDDPDAYCGYIKHKVEDSKESRKLALKMWPKLSRTDFVAATEEIIKLKQGRG